MGERRIGVCNLCEAICGLELTIEGRDVVGVRGNPDDPLSRGHICPKGVAIADVYADPDRLRRPVRRVGEGTDARWQEIGWDEAFDLVADNLARVINEHGDDALGVYLGNPNAHSLGSMTHGTAMFKSFRTKNRYSATSVDQLPHQLVAHLVFGHQLFLPIPDIDRTSWFLVVGGNPMASNGSLMTVPDFPQRLRDLRARGGRMVVLDPRRTETAKVADEHHFVRPGTDAWVLLAMLHVLTAEASPDDLPTVASYVDGLDTVVELVAEFTPERAEAVSGLPAAEVRRLARELAAADSGVVYSRIGVSAGPWGTVCQWAVTCLNVLTGNLDRPGGAMFTTPAIDAVGTGLIGRGHHDAWRSRVRGLPETAGELPVAALREEIETPGEGQVRALLTVAGNPVLSTPDGARLDRALRDLDFMAAVDIYVNETTRHADVILPPTTALERDHYDLVFHLLAVRNTARFTPAVFEKEPDQRHDWQVFREITLRTAARLDRKAPLKKRLVQRARLTASPTFLIGQLLRRGSSGVTLAKLRRRPGRHRPRSAPRRPAARPVAGAEQAGRPGARPRGGGRGPARERAGPRSRRAGPHRSPPPARLQLLDAQLRAAHPRPAAPPAADEPRRPGAARHRGRLARAGHLAGRVGGGRGGRVGRPDAGRGLAPPRLRARGRRRPDVTQPRGAGRLRQRPHRPRAARRVGQRRAQRRTRRRHRGLTAAARPRLRR